VPIPARERVSPRLEPELYPRVEKPWLTAGGEITGTEISYANARGAEIEETILRLD
jgi:hypothetical protein